MKRDDRYSQILCDAYAQQLPLSGKYSPYMIWKMAKSKDSMVRSDLARALVYNTESDSAIDILCKLAKDKDALVRADAIDSLREFCCERSYHVLETALTDPDALVRKYAAFGLAWVGKHLSAQSAEPLLLALEKRENHAHGKVGIYEGLYILGHEDRLSKLIGLFSINDYQIQCSVLNALSEIINAQNKPKIKAFIDTVERKRYPKSVLSCLIDLEKECCS